MPSSPQRRNDNEDVETNERVRSWLSSADIAHDVLENRLKRARQPRNSRSGYRNWGRDYMVSITHQRSYCDDPDLTVPTPTIFIPYNDPDGASWTDSEQWVSNSQSIYAERKTGIPFDAIPRDACQLYEAKFNRPLKKGNVKELKEPGASSGKLSLAPLRVVWSYLTEIDHVIGLDEGQTDKVYLECRRLKSLLHTIAACCDQEPMHE
jgi:hypothetical protein